MPARQNSMICSCTIGTRDYPWDRTTHYPTRSLTTHASDRMLFFALSHVLLRTLGEPVINKKRCLEFSGFRYVLDIMFVFFLAPTFQGYSRNIQEVYGEALGVMASDGCISYDIPSRKTDSIIPRYKLDSNGSFTFFILAHRWRATDVKTGTMPRPHELLRVNSSWTHDRHLVGVANWLFYSKKPPTSRWTRTW